MLNKERVLSALSKVEEPDLKKDLVSLKMIEDITVEGQKVSFTLVLTTPACPLKDKMASDCKEAITKEAGVDIELDINFISRVMGREALDNVLPKVKNVILISSGKGGVGKSTIAVNTALALADSGASVGLLDADIYGPSLRTLLDLGSLRPGMKEVDGKSMIIPVERYGVKVISIGILIDKAQAVVWRGPMASSALKQFFTDVDWGELDYLVIDMPPGTGDIHLTTAQVLKDSSAIVVTTPQKVAVDDSRKGANMFRSGNINIPILGVVENMSYFSPDEGKTKYHLFGKGGGEHLAKELDVPLIATIPLAESVSDNADLGKPAVLEKGSYLSNAFYELAGSIAQRLAMQNAQVEEQNV